MSSRCFADETEEFLVLGMIQHDVSSLAAIALSFQQRVDRPLRKRFRALILLLSLLMRMIVAKVTVASSSVSVMVVQLVISCQMVAIAFVIALACHHDCDRVVILAAVRETILIIAGVAVIFVHPLGVDW